MNAAIEQAIGAIDQEIEALDQRRADFVQAREQLAKLGGLDGAEIVAPRGKKAATRKERSKPTPIHDEADFGAPGERILAALKERCPRKPGELAKAWARGRKHATR